MPEKIYLADAPMDNAYSTQRHGVENVSYEYKTMPLVRKESVSVEEKQSFESLQSEDSSKSVHEYNLRDPERERLKKIEENYEKDKTMLAKQKQLPVLARSESHDVGHAVNTVNDGDLGKIASLQHKNIIGELRRRKKK
jgi:hypothetical protein